MNTVIISGRLCGDPEVRYTESQKPIAIARYRLAVPRYKSDEADFVNCVAFGKGAEFAEKYLHKGMKILVTGRIQTGSYTNRDGKQVYTTDIVVESHEFAESKQDNTPNKGSGGGFQAVPDELEKELPFK